MSVILVTGGTGLVGEALKWVIENDKSERFGKKEGETWVFLSSKDGDLRYNKIIFFSPFFNLLNH